jgi:hypothetical protein
VGCLLEKALPIAKRIILEPKTAMMMPMKIPRKNFAIIAA